jgi:hypothetical protein
MKLFNLFLLLLTFPGLLQAQSNKNIGGIDSIMRKDLMNHKFTVASIKEYKHKESLGFETQIADTPIREKGARERMELLQFVQGFEYGIHLDGVIGSGIRGNWTTAGKVVLLICGIETNKTFSYSI